MREFSVELCESISLPKVESESLVQGDISNSPRRKKKKKVISSTIQ